MRFEVVALITYAETIVIGHRIRDFRRLQRKYGRGRWRKRKAECIARLEGGNVRKAELHWYEATGIGRYELKIKRFLD